jgi:hypothetical protein
MATAGPATVIPAASKVDLCPLTSGDGSDAFWVCDEGVPGVAASVEDCVVGVEDAVAQVISAKELPDVFDRVKFGAIGRQGEQADIVGQPQPAAALVPASAVEDQDGVRTGRDLSADFGQVDVHRLGADPRQHERRPGATLRAYGAEQIGGAVPLVARRARPVALVGPDIAQRALLTDPCLVLPPDFERLVAGALRDRGLHQFSEVFLCASSASAS